MMIGPSFQRTHSEKVATSYGHTQFFECSGDPRRNWHAACCIATRLCGEPSTSARWVRNTDRQDCL